MAKTNQTRITTSQSTIASDVRILEQQRNSRAVVKVAAYCRVSTDMEIQKQSLETQMAAYNKIIEEHPGWVRAGKTDQLSEVDADARGMDMRHRQRSGDRLQEDLRYALADDIQRKCGA